MNEKNEIVENGKKFVEKNPKNVNLLFFL